MNISNFLWQCLIFFYFFFFNFSFSFSLRVEYVKYGMKAAVIDMVLLNQNSKQEYINVIFFLLVACIYNHIWMPV